LVLLLPVTLQAWIFALRQTRGAEIPPKSILFSFFNIIPNTNIITLMPSNHKNSLYKDSRFFIGDYENAVKI